MRNDLTRLFWGAILALAAAGPLAAQEPPAFGDLSTMTLSDDLKGTVRAPEFPPGDAWLNTPQPLTLKGLKGKIVLLDFWTYCCINCMHVIPDLKRLEEKYEDSLVVIGVHSAKFTTEKGTDAIREAVLRYGVRHPVVNDADFKIWGAYGVRAWPTFALIDPEGKVVGLTSGEGVYDALDPILAELTDHYKKEGKLDLKPFPYAAEADRMAPSPLAFPGKIAVDAKTDTLVISDSGHHRVLVASLEGKVRQVIGSGEAGFKDGGFRTARFFHPQGVCLDAGVVYVADTENHAIRKVDLKAGTVTTLAGTGRQARRYNQEGPGRTTALNSPWDLLKRGDRLYIAMAGSHQIWTLDLASGEAKVFAGSAREDIQDGPLKQAALAQTSGLSTDGDHLYFVDSETSSLRETGFSPSDSVTTLVGRGLFDFGDADGPAAQARFQHPIGLAWHDGSVYVADTYNNRIRRYDPRTRSVSTLLGSAQAGMKDGPAAQARLNEPCGLAFAGDKLYIADTNNQAIRILDLGSGSVTTLALCGLDTPSPAPSPEPAQALAAQTAAPGARELRVTIHLPEGRELNPQAPSRLELSSSDPAVARPERGSSPVESQTLTLPLSLHPGQATLTLHLTLFYCSHGRQALCFYKQDSLALPVTVSPQGAGELTVDYRVP